MSNYKVTVTIASGKGGTGKTSLAVILSYTATMLNWPVQLLDCDVEEPNTALFFKYEHQEQIKIFAKIPFIKSDFCNGCQRCANFCEFNAIIVNKKATILSEFCHRCGGCKLICPHSAIEEKDLLIGETNIIHTNKLKLITGRLVIGQANPGPIIQKVKSFLDKNCLNIIDAPPGSGCAMMEAVEDSDLVICIVEDSPFGLHDFQKAYYTLKEMSLPVAVVINKHNPEWNETKLFCEKESIPILLKIPFLPELQRGYATGNIFNNISRQWQKKFEQLLINAIAEINK